MVRSFLLLLLPTLGQAQGITVFGHKAPDTDAVTTALCYAWELNSRNIPAVAYRLGELNPETAFVLKTVGMEAPPVLGKLEPNTEVAIVDTNNPKELPDGIEQATIHSIVDHHKLIGGLQSPKPIEVDLRPLCSATSIVYARAKAAGLTIPKDIAGLMLSGIMSDSLGFRSPTTTDLDRQHAAELSVLSGLDAVSHGEAMLDAKGNIGHLSAAEMVGMDSKIFKLGGMTVRISVLETTKPSVPLDRAAELKQAMVQRTSDENLTATILFVVDILKEQATVITASPAGSGLVEHAWKATARSDGTYLLPGVMSRKKQMVPALEAAATAKHDL